MDPILRDRQAVEEIMETERSWVKALLEKDLAVMDQVMAPDYTLIIPGGKVLQKEAALASLFLAVFVKREGRWQMVADLSTEMDTEKE